MKPLPGHAQWTSPRTFVFNDQTPAQMFLQSFPELLYEAGKEAMQEILGQVKEASTLETARTNLETLAKGSLDLPVDLQMDILYERAVIESMRAKSLPRGSKEQADALHSAAASLVDWIQRGRNGAFAAMGRTLSAQLGG